VSQNQGEVFYYYRMQIIDITFLTANAVVVAVLLGIVLSLVWFIFWIRESQTYSLKGHVIFLAFVLGAAAVVFVLPIQKIIVGMFYSESIQIVLFSISEELLKCILFLLLVFVWPRKVTRPVDYVVYAMVIALGFTALENGLYFLHPIETARFDMLAVAGSRRFVGTTLMHTVSSMLPAIGIGLAYFKTKRERFLYGFVGFLGACLLHVLFNLFVDIQGKTSFYISVGVIWVCAFVLLYIIEKLRNKGTDEYILSQSKVEVNRTEKLFTEILSRIDSSNDSVPIVALLAQKGITEGTKEYAIFTEFMNLFKKDYASYLRSVGTKSEDIDTVVRSVISDSIPLKAVTSILLVLKNQLERLSE